MLRRLRAVTKERTWHEDEGVVPLLAGSGRALGAVWLVCSCRQIRELFRSHAVCAYRAAAWTSDASRLPLERTLGLELT